MLLDKFCGYINDLFSVQTIKDYSNNGLQVEGRGDISKVAFSVDASMDGFEKAAAVGADIIIVHHGLFWGQPLMISGYHRRRVQFLLDNEISLYALHLPLDYHKTLGNNTAIAESAGYRVCDETLYSNGDYAGCIAEHEKGFLIEDIVDNLKISLSVSPLKLFPDDYNNDLIKRIGVVTGSGMRYGIDAARMNAELFITGESSHAWYHPIVETGIPCLLYGHYISETLGLKRLLKKIKKDLKLEGVFIDTPSGM
ncbi:MAG: Nif3-like dinuclear metal center hexameric protein [Spirochaetes bacterium]|nr:Nif3-like dinuclear metal center hexameric protein [Spirochaetota bacterium]